MKEHLSSPTPFTQQLDQNPQLDLEFYIRAIQHLTVDAAASFGTGASVSPRRVKEYILGRLPIDVSEQQIAAAAVELVEQGLLKSKTCQNSDGNYCFEIHPEIHTRIKLRLAEINNLSEEVFSNWVSESAIKYFREKENKQLIPQLTWWLQRFLVAMILKHGHNSGGLLLNLDNDSEQWHAKIKTEIKEILPASGNPLLDELIQREIPAFFTKTTHSRMTYLFKLFNSSYTCHLLQSAHGERCSVNAYKLVDLEFLHNLVGYWDSYFTKTS